MKTNSILLMITSFFILPLISSACGFQKHELNLMWGLSPFVSKEDLREDYSIGKNIGLNYAYRICPFISFQLRTNYSQFSVKKNIIINPIEEFNNDNNNPELNLYNFNLSVRANCYRCHNFQHYSFIGAGISIIDKDGYTYNYPTFLAGSIKVPSVTENNFQIQAGTGVDYKISNSFSVNLETTLQYIFTKNSFSKNIWFNTFQLGITYKFGKE